MLTIWKFALRVTEEQYITVPMGAEILTVQVQDGALQLWAVVNPEGEKVEQLISIRGTGHPFQSRPGKFSGYIASVQLNREVLHVFEGAAR